MTGVWQVFGRNIVAFDDWMRMDLKYIRQTTLWYDLRLLALTLLVLRAPIQLDRDPPSTSNDPIPETV